MPANILGIGTALPTSVPQEAALHHAKALICSNKKQERILDGLYRKSNINSRCTVLPEADRINQAETFLPYGNQLGPSTAERMDMFAESIIPLSIDASVAAINNAGITPDQITHLVTVTCTGFFAPGFDIALIKHLPLSPEITRAQIGFMGCHGSINALKMIRSICLSQPNAIVLLCAAELCTLHFQYEWKADSLIANSIFADGAAAMVIGNGVTSHRSWSMANGASYIVPNSENTMAWKIGDHGFQMKLENEIGKLIQTNLKPWLQKWLRSQNLEIDTIANWAIHPGGRRILDATQAALNLSDQCMQPSRTILAEYGNMSSPSVLFILDKLNPANGPCVTLGFGPGLAIESALLIPT